MSIRLGGGPPAGVGAAGRPQEKGVIRQGAGAIVHQRRGRCLTALWPPGEPYGLKEQRREEAAGPDRLARASPVLGPSVLSTG